MTCLSLIPAFSFQPPLPIAVVTLLVCLAIVGLAASAIRERTRWLLALRLIGLAGLVWLLTGPSTTEQGNPSNIQRPKLTLLVDTSLSMAQRDAQDADGNAVSRIEAVTNRWLNADRLRTLRAHSEVEVLGFDEQLRPADSDILDATGPATRLHHAIAQTRSDATLILSDGHDTSPFEPRPDLSSAGRLFASPVGSPRSTPDLAIDAWPDSDRLFEGQRTTITATVRQQGFANQRAVVRLFHEGQLIEQRTIELGPMPQPLRFDVRPELAPREARRAHHYKVVVELDQGSEAYTGNNQQNLFIYVSRDKVKVLLLEGEPYWDTRSLARLLGTHPRFDLTALYGFGDKRRSRVLGESVPPQSDPVQQLERFDVLVLGRLVERLVDAGFADRLTAYVRGGGAVVFARGRPFGEGRAGQQLLQAVDAISPVAWGESVVADMRVRLANTSDARGPLADLQDSSVLSRLPGMLAATRIEGRKAASLVLLEQQQGEGTAMAAMTSMRSGAGVSLAVLTEGLWRWDLLPGMDADPATATLYDTLWVRAMQWLASGGVFLPGQDIAIEADRMTLEPGQATTLTVSTRYIEQAELDLTLNAIDPDGQTLALALNKATTAGSYTAIFTPEDVGIYRFELAAPGRSDLIEPAQPITTYIAAVHRSPEQRDTSAKPQALKQLTETSGGRCLEPDETGPITDYLQTLQSVRGAAPITDYSFNTWPTFVWIASCFGLEWALRRRIGLR